MDHLGKNQLATFEVRPLSRELQGYFVAAFKLVYVVTPGKPKPPKKRKGENGNGWAQSRSGN